MADKSFKVRQSVNLHPQTGAPANPQEGDMYFEDSTKQFNFYQDGSFKQLGTSFGAVPIGGVIAVFDNSVLAGAITLPASGVVQDGWMLADGAAVPAGQTINEAVTLPDLTDDRFIMGDTVASLTGAGANSFNTGTASATWSSTTVNTSFTQPSFNKTVMNTNQSDHNHSISAPAHHHNIGTHHHFVGQRNNDATNPRIMGWVNSTGSGIGPSEIMVAGGALDIDAGTGPRDSWNIGAGFAPFNNATWRTSEANGGVTESGGGGSGSSGGETAVWTSATVNTTGGAASFNKNVMNTNQTAHSHAVSDSRPKYLSAVYLIRVS